MNKTKQIIMALLLTVAMPLFAQSIDTDPLVKTMQEELKYNMEQLAKKPHSAYFMSLRMVDSYNCHVESVFGAASANERHSRIITPQVRVGDKDLDNYKYTSQSTENPNMRNAQGIQVPLDGAPLSAYRQAIWNETMKRYRIAENDYEKARSRMQTEVDNEDKAPCFSDAPVEKYYEAALPQEYYVTDKAKWTERLNRVSQIFKDCRELQSGVASIDVVTEREYVVNTAGTAIVQNRHTLRIMLNASIKADDGMNCPLYVDYFGFKEDELPSDEVLAQAAHDLVSRLLALKSAPMADPYTGPAILSGSASGVFFHEIFGHRLESHRMKSGGQTFKKMVGERVLPKTFNVYCDPTLRYYGKQPLNGHYLYDDEGVKAQRVHCVENGVLRNFLMGRIPVDGFPASNGHGRASGGNDPTSRQSNLIVETEKPYTEQELKQMLILEAKKQGKEYGYFFKTATSGYTYTGEGGTLNSFNVEPIEVYRVFVDGRADELVRGVALIGTPLSVFSNIEAAADKPHTFVGSCGAESGWIPVTATSPMIFVSKIETQRTQLNRNLPQVLALPAYEGGKVINGDDEMIFKAMGDEMRRAKDSLVIEGNGKPYLVDYRLITGAITSFTAELGGVKEVVANPVLAAGSANVVLGDSILSSIYRGSEYGFGNNFQQQLTYDNLRRNYWMMTDASYKSAIGNLAQKKENLKRTPLPEEDVQVPDLTRSPATRFIAEEDIEEGNDTALMRRIACELSAVFADYPQLYNTSAMSHTASISAYRTTSEGLQIKVPMKIAEIVIDASVRTDDGCILSDKKVIVRRADKDFSNIDSLKEETKRFAELLIEKGRAKAVKEYYMGPIMLEEEAVSEAFLREVIGKNAIAQRDPVRGSNINSMLVGKRILDTNISVSQLSDIPYYRGEPIAANYEMDANGVKPAKELPIIEKGILKTLISGRNPAVEATAPTGSANFNLSSLLSISNFPNVLHVKSSKTIQHSKMKARLISEAKKAGVKYTYIIKAPKDSWRYLVRVDVATGKEEIVRTAAIPQPSRSAMMHVIACSNEEFVANKEERNGICSTITPKSMIIENVEYSFGKPERAEPFTLQNPMQR